MKCPMFSRTGCRHERKVLRREKFLAEMDAVISWTRLVELIGPLYAKADGTLRGHSLITMLRIHCLQHFFRLSDPAMEEMLYDSTSMRRFAGLGLHVDPVPDETAIAYFRHLLEKHRLDQMAIEEINAYLSDQGLVLKPGAIVEAVVASPPRRPINGQAAHARLA